MSPRLSKDRGLVFAAAHFAAREDAVLLDPGKRLLERRFRVRLEHQPLAGTPAPGIHLIVEAQRKFFLVVVRVELGPQIDVALGAAQAAEIFAYILRIGRAVDDRRHHEGGVDDFAKAELLDKIVRPAEQRDRRHLAIDQHFHAAEQKAVAKRELDLLQLEILLEPLDGRVVAARLVADRDRHAGEIGRRLYRRVRRYEDAAGRDRIALGVEFAVTVGGGDVHRPVASGADIAGAPGFQRLIGADLVAELVAAAEARI